jgi:hypothetical protein
MRTTSMALLGCLLLWAGGGLAAESPFAGRWNLTGTGEHRDHVYWLEITEENGILKGMFLHRGGSPVPLPHVAAENGELIFHLSGGEDRPGPEFRARLENGRLVGRAKYPDRTVEWTGVRSPSWPPADANARHTYGTPVALFNGTSLDNWELQHTDRSSGWSVADGAMINEPKANNLISRRKFKDFKIVAEYKLEKDSNSGIYLRGRHELQVLDDFGKPPESHGHMAIYAWTPPRVNASKAPGEWQAMEATLVGNRLSVTLNGQRVHDNVVVQAITGGALDADEQAPGPIMIQGDHGRVWIRKLVITPITAPGGK